MSKTKKTPVPSNHNWSEPAEPSAVDRLREDPRCYNDREDQLQADLERDHSIEHLPEDVKNRVYGMAYEEQHAYGYFEVANGYGDYAELARIAYEAGKAAR